MAEDARPRPEILSLEEKIAMAMRGINESSSKTTCSPQAVRKSTKAQGESKPPIISSTPALMSSLPSSSSHVTNIDADCLLHNPSVKKSTKSYESKLSEVDLASSRGLEIHSKAVDEGTDESMNNLAAHNIYSDEETFVGDVGKAVEKCISSKTDRGITFSGCNSSSEVSQSSTYADLLFNVSPTTTVSLGSGEVGSTPTSREVTKLLMAEKTPPESPAPSDSSSSLDPDALVTLDEALVSTDNYDSAPGEVSNAGCIDLGRNDSLVNKFFEMIDKNGDGHISLLELNIVARDGSSVEAKMLHDLLGLPDHVRQEDGTKDKIVQIFADLHAGKDPDNVTIDTLRAYVESCCDVMNKNKGKGSNTVEITSVSEDMLLELESPSSTSLRDENVSNTENIRTSQIYGAAVVDKSSVWNIPFADMFEHSVLSTTTAEEKSANAIVNTRLPPSGSKSPRTYEHCPVDYSNDGKIGEKIGHLTNSDGSNCWSFHRLRNFKSSSPNNHSVIKISARIRPLISREVDVDARHIVSTAGDKIVLVNPSAFEVDPDVIAAAASVSGRANQWTKEFRFDNCLWSYNSSGKKDISIDQSEVFSISGTQMVDKVMNGGSVLCCTYGSSGSGKSYTMFGNILGTDILWTKTKNVCLNMKDEIPIDYGLLPRVYCDVVNRIKNNAELDSDTKITMSFMEIGNEKIRDLLHPTDFETFNCKIKEKNGSSPYVENVTKTSISSISDVIENLIVALRRKKTISSRKESNTFFHSHTFVVLEISPVLPSMTAARNVNFLKDNVIRIDMVDLADSQSDANRSRQSKNHRKSEMTMIRRSLSTLGYILKELGRGIPSRGLPFRDSALTWLLKGTLSDNYHISFISTISPSDTCYEETLSTLKYAHRLVKDKGGQLTLSKEEIANRNKSLVSHSAYLGTNDPSPDDIYDALSTILFKKIDKNGDGHISLLELNIVARDGSSVEAKMLHDLLGLPDHVRQEDGTKDKIVQIFADLHAGKDPDNVTIDTLRVHLKSCHDLLNEEEKNTDANNMVESLSRLKGTNIARDVLRLTISDPQQRLAKLNPYEKPLPPWHSVESNRSTLDAYQDVTSSASCNGLPDKTSVKDDEFYEVARQIESGVEPTMESSSKQRTIFTSSLRADEVDDNANDRDTMMYKYSFEDMRNSSGVPRSPNFKEAYRILQGQLVEKQIEIEVIRADRDILMLELEKFRNTNVSNFHSPPDIIVNKEEIFELQESSRLLEAQVIELKDLVHRKEEKIGNMMDKLVRIKDENSTLRHDFGTSRVNVEEKNVKIQILERENAKLHEMLEKALSENTKLKENLDFYKEESSKLKKIGGNTEPSLKQKIDDLSQQLVTLKSKKDQVERKNSQLTEDVVFFQQQNKTLKYQADKAKDEMEQSHVKNYRRLECEVKKIREDEDKIARFISNCRFEECNDDTDISKILKEIESELSYYMYNDICKNLVALISNVRVAIQRKLTLQLESTRLLLEKTNEENIFSPSFGAGTFASIEWKMRDQDSKSDLAESGIQLLHESSISCRDASVVENGNSLDSSELNLGQTDALQKKISNYRMMNNMLQDQLDYERQSSRNCDKRSGKFHFDLRAKENVAANGTRLGPSPVQAWDAEMEKDYASLWLAIKELSELDAEKELAIEELLEERDSMNSKIANLEKQNLELKSNISKTNNPLYTAMEGGMGIDSIDHQESIHWTQGTHDKPNTSFNTEQLVNTLTEAIFDGGNGVRY